MDMAVFNKSASESSNESATDATTKQALNSLQNNQPANMEDTDALTTLASAALQRNEEMNAEVIEEKIPEPYPWCDVGIVRNSNLVVKSFYPTSVTNEHESISRDNLPNYSNLGRVNLEPGTAYKFRLAAINSCGRGEWSEVSAFKTCLPGYPGAPSSIKISKSIDGAHLSWEPPPSTSGRILEYSVCLAISSTIIPESTELKGLAGGSQNQLTFVRVYCGAQNQATVSTSSLNAAYVDTTNKPAIIFRIAARNEKGYGPATQVRWLQESVSKLVELPNQKREMLSFGNQHMTKKYKASNF